MQDKQGEGRLPAKVPRVLVAPRYKRGVRRQRRKKNDRTARKGGQNPAYRTRTAPFYPRRSPYCPLLRKVQSTLVPDVASQASGVSAKRMQGGCAAVS